jgi:hypothetical protein
MEDPSLTHEEAATVAKMHGNQAVLRKLHEWKIPATTETFANALYAYAHGESATRGASLSLLRQIQISMSMVTSSLREIGLH